MIITSVQNDLVKKVTKLKNARDRKEQGAFLAEGARLVSEVLRSDFAVQRLIIQSGKENAFQTLLDAANCETITVTENVMAKITDTKTPQGIAAVIDMPGYEPASNDRILALDGIADPGNMGTILRTAWAFGCKEVWVGDGCADPYSPKCVRSGMGAHFHMAIVECKDLPNMLYNNAKDYEIVGGHLKGSEQIVFEKNKCICVIGSEANGMSDETANACSKLFRIPMEGRAESLNASVAAGILMYTAWVLA